MGSAFNHTFARKSNSRPRPGAPAAAFRILLDDRYFRPVDGDGDRADQNRAENDVLGEDINADEGHADAHHRDDQRPDQRAPYAPDAAGDRRSAENDGGDRRQQEFARQGRRAAGEASGENHSGQAGAGAGQDEGDDLLPIDLHAGSIGRRLAGADRGAVAAETGAALDRVGDRENEERDHDDVRDAEEGSRYPRLVVALARLQGDRAFLRQDKGRAEQHAAHRQGGDKGGHFQADMRHSGEKEIG